MLWQIEQVSKHDHWTHTKQICSTNSATFGLKFDYRTRALSNLIICQAIYRHSTGIRRMYHLFGYISTIRQGSDECCRFFATLPMYPKNGYIAMYAIFAYMDSQGSECHTLMETADQSAADQRVPLWQGNYIYVLGGGGRGLLWPTCPPR